MTLEVIPSASRTKDDIIDYSDDDNIESMGSNASYEQEELPHPPPEVVGQVFSSMRDSMPRTKEEATDGCSDEDDDDDDGEEEHDVHRNLKVLKLPKTTEVYYNRFKFFTANIYGI